MIKAFRYPETLNEEAQESLEYSEDYSNYVQDEYLKLPVLPEEFHKVINAIAGDENGEISFPMVVYTIDEEMDIPNMNLGSLGGGGFYNGEFSSYTDKYFIACPEYGMGTVIAPIEMRELLVEHFNTEEEYEKEEGEEGDKANKLEISSVTEAEQEHIENSSKLMNKLFHVQEG